MKVGMVSNINYNYNNQPNFKAVNQKFYKKALRNYECGQNAATSDWLMSLTDDLFLFKDISKQDAIDTMNAVRKYVDPESLEAFEYDFDLIKNS